MNTVDIFKQQITQMNSPKSVCLYQETYKFEQQIDQQLPTGDSAFPLIFKGIILQQIFTKNSLKRKSKTTQIIQENVCQEINRLKHKYLMKWYYGAKKEEVIKSTISRILCQQSVSKGSVFYRLKDIVKKEKLKQEKNAKQDAQNNQNMQIISNNNNQQNQIYHQLQSLNQSQQTILKNAQPKNYHPIQNLPNNILQHHLLTKNQDIFQKDQNQPPYSYYSYQQTQQTNAYYEDKIQKMDIGCQYQVEQLMQHQILKKQQNQLSGQIMLQRNQSSLKQTNQFQPPQKFTKQPFIHHQNHNPIFILSYLQNNNTLIKTLKQQMHNKLTKLDKIIKKVNIYQQQQHEQKINKYSQ